MKIQSPRLNLEFLESRKLCAVDLSLDIQASPVAAYFASSVSYHNANNPADVDGDGAVSPIDALRLIDALNRNGTMNLASIQANRMASGAEGEQDPIGHVDTNNDGSLNPMDVLVVIDTIHGDSHSGDQITPTAHDLVDPDSSIDFSTDTSFEFPFEDMTSFERMFGKILALESIDLSEYSFAEYDISHLSEEDLDGVFQEIGFDPEWVIRSGLDEEIPMMFSEDFPTMDFEDPELLPLFNTMATFFNSIASVALFSENGLLAQVARQNAEQNTSMEMAPVTYFSSNFLRGNRS